ncbi:FAD binding domain-containing protein [Rhodococcus opacus]|uniref:FAD binding domain-containing protein n=1 Tax=Rhodococcus opacus TaxID=37919 RepID=UPI00130070BC|nr:FAD binding domain-containing protein [Rhodococcus opacus]
MIRTNLRYHRPDSLAAASDLLWSHRQDIAVLGGGTHLLPRMTRDQESVSHIVDLKALGLDGVNISANGVSIGSRVTYDQVLRHDALTRILPLLARVSHGVTGGRQVRNIGTLGGSACFAMPGSDMPGALVGLRSRFRIHGPTGFREVDSTDFFTSAFVNALEPGEFLHSFDILDIPTATGYHKIKHSAGSWPIATATAALWEGQRLEITLGGVQETPVRIDVTKVADQPEEFAAAIDAAITEPWDDVLAPGSYRRRVAAAAAKRALSELRRRVA